VYTACPISKMKLAIEYLPGQFDQRADSAVQCIKLIDPKSDPTVTTGTMVLFDTIDEESFNTIKQHLINKVEAREKNLNNLEIAQSDIPEEVIQYTGFTLLNQDELVHFHTTHGLAMSNEDLRFVQSYFIKNERRDPFITEIKVLDTYWSDHCRHTTFETEISNITFSRDDLSLEIEESFKEYLKMRNDLDRNHKPITLMDIATINSKYEKANGNLEDIEISDEINAASIYIDVDVEGVTEKWLLMFKNETHNHPTEIEPFGGASTCIGGAIRDPLSGRSYVYSAMRITGAANINEDISKTIPGKLPQRVISKVAAKGYSSYGNQIGLATTFVNEIHHDGYKAKRMEIGAVVAAAKASNVVRKKPEPGDIVILLGGRTGRDGIGGATGSSKVHTEDSIETASAEVQKGNAPEERKIQRLFRNPEVTHLIKKSNDFGAGGVSVAIGELADGLLINLDNVPTKYNGINGTELAISESQERMSVVIDKENETQFIELCHKENIEAVVIAVVTKEKRLVMKWKDEVICDLSREFIETSGVRQKTNISFKPISKKTPFNRVHKGDTSKEQIINMLQDPNIATKQGLDEMFDSTIGRTTVLAPYGGKYQLTKTQTSIHKIPTLDKHTNTVSMMAYGFNPYISQWSPYHGASYAVIDSLAKIVAAGGEYSSVRFTFQEYFERLNNDPYKWSKPLSALLGAMKTLKEFNLPAIGGKDSMSGTFNEISVPPTLVSFAVQTANIKDVISNELKSNNTYIYLIKHVPTKEYLPNYECLKLNYNFITSSIKNKIILSSQTLEHVGIAEAIIKMSFGNKIGFKIKTDLPLFDYDYGSIIVESKELLGFENAIYLGKTTHNQIASINNDKFSIDECIEINQSLYKSVYPIVHKDDRTLTNQETHIIKTNINNLIDGDVKVLIPVFPGTNCEYDTESAFLKEGAKTTIFVFNNQTQKDIEQSINSLEKLIDESHILMLSGGFSSGDEPDGSGKFIASVLRNDKINGAIQRFLQKKHLILGICNGFQALVKSGLLPYGEIQPIQEDDPTLFKNTINRHISKFVTTKVSSVHSPWLKSFNKNDIHTIAMSHGEGKFIINEEKYKSLIKNDQIAFQYVDENNEPTYNPLYNPNGSSYAIEGIISKDGLILGKMGHSERYSKDLFINIYGNKDQNIFRNAIEYFKGKGE